MSNKITKWALDALVTFGAAPGPGDKEMLKQMNWDEIVKVMQKINRSMEDVVPKDNLKILHIERTNAGWILYRDPELHDSGEAYPFV